MHYCIGIETVIKSDLKECCAVLSEVRVDPHIILV